MTKITPEMAAERHADYMARAERAYRALLPAGRALKAIRDRRLYREDYPSFNDFCRFKMELTIEETSRLIAIAGDFPPRERMGMNRPFTKFDEAFLLDLAIAMRRHHEANPRTVRSNPVPTLAASRPTVEAIPADLYRLFNADGVLLYIGVSLDFAKRSSSHRMEKPWWSEVVSITMEHFTDRLDALHAETTAITKEKPLYNRTGKPREEWI